MKIIVAHPGRQHSYRVATALKEAGMLYKYATTVYNKQSSLLMRILKFFLNRENFARASRRVCPLLIDEDVIQFCELDALIHLALIRIDFTHKLSGAYGRYISKKFQRRLANYIIKEKINAVISYDTNSEILFSILREKAPEVVRIMDNAHPNRHFLYHDYQSNWKCVEEFERTLSACGYLTDLQVAKSFGDEVKLANYHIVASSYSQRALLFEGIQEKKIWKVPYGVDQNKFIESNRIFEKGRLNILFLGEVNQRKGIRQFLETAKQISSDQIRFNIVGCGENHCPDLYTSYKSYANFKGYVSYEELLNQLSINHVFLFPTMGEGFGLVLLEAMAAGMPVITTNNCAGSDIVDEGENGFIVPVGSVTEIVERLLFLLENPDELKKMSENAREKARLYTWERYNSNIVSMVKSLKEI